MKKVNASLFDKFGSSKLTAASSVKGGAQGGTAQDTCTGPDYAPDCGDIQDSTTNFETDSTPTTIEFDHGCTPTPGTPVAPAPVRPRI